MDLQACCVRNRSPAEIETEFQLHQGMISTYSRGRSSTKGRRMLVMMTFVTLVSFFLVGAAAAVEGRSFRAAVRKPIGKGGEREGGSVPQNRHVSSARLKERTPGRERGERQEGGADDVSMRKVKTKAKTRPTPSMPLTGGIVEHPKGHTPPAEGGGGRGGGQAKGVGSQQWLENFMCLDKDEEDGQPADSSSEPDPMPRSRSPHPCFFFSRRHCLLLSPFSLSPSAPAWLAGALTPPSSPLQHPWPHPACYFALSFKCSDERQL
eukprot:1605756-Rhodomonas_salina.2